MRIWSKFRSLFRKDKLETEMTEEMRHHVELQTELNIKAGMKPDDARYAALRQFGNVASIQAQAREQRGWLWLEQLRQDFRFALRGLGQSRGFTALAVLTLALGIGMTTSIFSIVYGVLLEPYPYDKPAEIWEPAVLDLKNNRGTGLRITDYLEMAKLPGVASAMATGYGQVTLSGGLNPEIINSPQLTGTAFPFLNVSPLLGRGLTPADFQTNGEAQPVTVLSFKLWQRLFNGDLAVIGRTVVLDEVPHVIVGVMPPRFGWYTDDGLWRPMPTLDLTRGVRVIVRLKPGVTAEVAGQQLLALMQEQARREPNRFPQDGFTTRFNNYLNVTVASGAMRLSLITLLIAVGFLLLLVCTNVANLQLARGVGRSREMAVRMALGAGRGRIFRQLLTESVVLSLAGGVLGVMFAYGLLQIIVLLLPPNYVPNEARITLNGWVLAFSAGIAVLTGVLSGLLPGWQSTRLDVNDSLKDGGQGAGASHRGSRARNTLVVTEVTLSVILLIGASVSIRGFLQMQNVDRGFQTERMLLLQIPLNAKRYTEFAQRNGFARDFIARIRQLPGVLHATWGVPPGLEGKAVVTIAGQPKPPDGLAVNFIDEEYIATYGIALKDGRNFTGHELAAGEHVALISEAAAKLWTNGENPIGRTITVDSLVGDGPNSLPSANASKEVTVIGIMADTHVMGPQLPAPLAVLVPYTLRAPIYRVLVMRTAMEPAGLLNAVRSELRALDKEQPMLRPITFEEKIQEQMQQPRFNLALLGTLAGIALVLAAAGIYSLMSYTVAQRSREIGLRMALGAERTDVLRLFLKLGGRLLVEGLVIGLAISLALAKIVSSQVFSGPVFDPVAYSVALGVLSVTALLACYIPALRATKVDPMIALRAE